MFFSPSVVLVCFGHMFLADSQLVVKSPCTDDLAGNTALERPKDSDVQACWSADHDVQLRTLKLGFQQRQQILNERVKQGHLDELGLEDGTIGKDCLLLVHVERWGLRILRNFSFFCANVTPLMGCPW